ncbi:hypothetical protein ZHAS_00007181 [Anopheles sinensis]|uniref:Uncharacterized protein n=1 Tax=Anopheles sinensis TaxID=74873 RepID=A0A084VPB9_ANOSI|nr:hypothetical protein ZHAS_00007181 [Anopheles sinensis]
MVPGVFLGAPVTGTDLWIYDSNGLPAANATAFRLSGKGTRKSYEKKKRTISAANEFPSGKPGEEKAKEKAKCRVGKFYPSSAQVGTYFPHETWPSEA